MNYEKEYYKLLEKYDNLLDEVVSLKNKKSSAGRKPKLTPIEREFISNSEEKKESLALRFNVSIWTIDRIRRGK